MFDNGYEFKQYFTLLLKGFYIKPFLTTNKNPLAYAPVKRLHRVILNITFTNDIDNKVFDYIDPWGETLASIACSIRYYYHRTIMATPFQDIFRRDMIFKLASAIY